MRSTAAAQAIDGALSAFFTQMKAHAWAAPLFGSRKSPPRAVGPRVAAIFLFEPGNGDKRCAANLCEECLTVPPSVADPGQLRGGGVGLHAVLSRHGSGMPCI